MRKHRALSPGCSHRKKRWAVSLPLLQPFLGEPAHGGDQGTGDLLGLVLVLHPVALKAGVVLQLVQDVIHLPGQPGIKVLFLQALKIPVLPVAGIVPHLQFPQVLLPQQVQHFHHGLVKARAQGGGVASAGEPPLAQQALLLLPAKVHIASGAQDDAHALLPEAHPQVQKAGHVLHGFHQIVSAAHPGAVDDLDVHGCPSSQALCWMSHTRSNRPASRSSLGM